jgi:hypothetical protein
MKIVVQQVFPHEWLALDEDRDPSPTGTGCTREAAIEDLMERLESGPGLRSIGEVIEPIVERALESYTIDPAIGRILARNA